MEYLKNAVQIVVARYHRGRHILLPLLAFTIGLALPYLVLKALTGKEGGIIHKKLAVKDTVFVQLLNVRGSDLAFNGRQGQTAGLSKSSGAHFSGDNPIDTVAAPDPFPFQSTQITKLESVGAASSQRGFNNLIILLATYPSVTFILLIVGIIILRSLFVFVLRSINPVIQKESDPHDLRRLFHAHASQIISLGSPRKIKRFSNKLRFQYYVMRSKGFPEEYSAALAEVLLAIEKESVMYKMDSWEDFRAWVSGRLPDDGKERLKKEIYELNRGNVI